MAKFLADFIRQVVKA